MRYVRFRTRTGSVAAGVIDGDEVAPLDHPLASLVARGRAELDAAGRRAIDAPAARLALGGLELLPPVEPVTVVAPGPRPAGAASRDLSAHREFYLKSAHTLHPSTQPIPYRAAVGILSYRAQLGMLMEPGLGRRLDPDEVLDGVLGVVLVAELMSVDLLRVGWEGTMWHSRFGEGASFDGAAPCGPWLATGEDVAIAGTVLRDAWGEAAVDPAEVAADLAYVSGWMALGPDLLVLGGSRHGPGLTLDGGEPVVEFGGDEPRLRAGDSVRASADGLGKIDALVGAAAAGRV